MSLMTWFSVTLTGVSLGEFKCRDAAVVEAALLCDIDSPILPISTTLVIP